MKNKKLTISDGVLNQIKSGKVQMKPGIYFALLSVLSVVAIGAMGLAMIYLSGIVFFWFRVINASGNAYGIKNNLVQTIGSFPWWTIIVFIVSTAFIVLIVRRFGTVYRHKTRNIALIVIALSIMLGFGLSFFGVGNLDHSNNDRQNGQVREFLLHNK